MQLRRRVKKDGSPPPARVRVTVAKERVKVKEKEKIRVVVNQAEKKKVKTKAKVKARASLRAKARAKEKERAPTDVKYVARRDLSILGLPVEVTPIARECALRAETRAADPEQEKRFGSCVRTSRVSVKSRMLPAFLA
jgi:hypothetical protein